MTIRKVVGWFLFALGIIWDLSVIVGSIWVNVVGRVSEGPVKYTFFIIGLLVLGGIFIWIGWMLSHPRKKREPISQPPDEPGEVEL